MVEIGPKPGSALFPICIVGDAGGVHVRTRALAMARLGHEVHLVTPRASGRGDLNESVPVSGRFAKLPFLMSDHARRMHALHYEARVRPLRLVPILRAQVLLH